MQTVYSSLDALEALATDSKSGKTLQQELSHLHAVLATAPSGPQARQELKQAKHSVDQAIKGYHKAITRLGSAIDKTAYHPPPLVAPARFQLPESQDTLDQAIQQALLRRGLGDALQVFERETGKSFDRDALAKVEELEAICRRLQEGDLDAALRWTTTHSARLPPTSPLPFALHRSAFLSLLHPTPSSSTAAPRSGQQSAALAYATAHFAPFYADHKLEIHRLLATLVLPVGSDLASAVESPYADLAGEGHRACLEPTLRATWAEMERVADREVLGRAVAIGADGGVARLEKALTVLAGGGVGSGSVNELPIEIPLTAEDRHHSIFVCPVSKELATPSVPSGGASAPAPASSSTLPSGQSVPTLPSMFLPSYATSPALSSPSVSATNGTQQQQAQYPQGNPAVMLKCGHTVVKESLKRLARGGGRAGAAGRGVKCAYCPVETPAGKELELHF